MKVIQKVSPVFFSPTIAFEMKVDGVSLLNVGSLHLSTHFLYAHKLYDAISERNWIESTKPVMHHFFISPSAENGRPLRAPFGGPKRWKFESAQSTDCAECS
jgi:hypothetical protein